MLNLFHIDLVVVSVRADPFDPKDAFLEIDGHDETIIIPLHIEHDAVCRNDTGGRITALYLCSARPRMPRLMPGWLMRLWDGAWECRLHPPRAPRATYRKPPACVPRPRRHRQTACQVGPQPPERPACARAKRRRDAAAKCREGAQSRP